MKENKKRTMKDEIEDSFKYRWEFVRRNEEYREDYKAWESFHNSSNQMLNSPFKDIYTKYETPPLNYKFTYDELMREAKKYVPLKRRDFPEISAKEDEQLGAYFWVLSSGRSLIVSPICGSAFAFEDLFQNRTKKGANILTVAIDVRYPVEMIIEVLKEEVSQYRALCEEEVVDYERDQNRFQKEMPGVKLLSFTEGIDISLRKKQLERYDDYLNVFDLKKNKTSVRKIIKKLYPNEYKAALSPGSYAYDSLKDRVKNHFNAAQRLIDGGYKDIK